jgi:23S rRNA (cytosine1962-C5)-methyltransferase
MVTKGRLEKNLREYDRRRPPREGERLPQVELRTTRGGRHPWVFRRMLRDVYDQLEPGTLVEAVGRDGSLIGRGFYNPRSEIALRILTEDPRVTPDARWFRAQIAQAVEFRHQVLKLQEQNDAYRLIHSEGDGLSGLVVDRFANVLVAEIFSAGMFLHWEWVAAALREQFPGSEIVMRADRRSEKHEGVKMDGPPPSAESRHLVIREGKARFEVDLRRGHKTGFFLDQRENRARMAELARGHELFDGFCYTGGFALHAGLAGAKQVEAVDLDEDAIEVAERNRALNGLGETVHFSHGNVFDVLREYRTTGRHFPRMVLDPAKLALSRQELPKALGAYRDMNRLGMQCVKSGGVLLSCSCTGLVSESDFLDALHAAADEARLDLQILHVAGAAPDHPFLARMPEGRYLKAVFSRVRPLT